MFWLSLFLATLLCLGLPSTAQDFDVPTNWRKPTSSLSHDARLSLVDAVLETILPTFDETSGLLDGLSITQTASLLCALSTGDLINSSTTSRNAVIDSLATVFTLNANISSIWGLAAINAYKAYQDQGSLGFAKAVWQQVGKFFITVDQAASGTHPLRNTTFSPECNGATTAGGVLFRPDVANDTEVNGETAAAYMALSARLFEATSDDQYHQAAELSATFVQNHLYSNGVILDTITINDCKVTNETVTYNSAFTIDGLSVLASKNSSWTPFLNSLVSTVVRNTTWTNPADGINTEGPSSAADANNNNFFTALKGILIRALYETWSRSEPDSAVANFIASYITVQFNALQDLASTPGINRYSPKWDGPPPTQFLPGGQLAALDVLNSALGFTTRSSPDATTSTSGFPTSHSSSPGGAPTTSNGSGKSGNDKHNSPPIAAIAGGIVAAVVMILFVILAIFFYRRARRHYEEEYTDQQLQASVEPYPRSSWDPSSLLSSVPKVPPLDLGANPFGGSPYIPRPPIKSAAGFLGPSADASATSDPRLPHAAEHTSDQPHANTDAVPELLERLNQLISVLPRGGVEEEPPRYER